jgi:hypothetical protein
MKKQILLGVLCLFIGMTALTLSGGQSRNEQDRGAKT